MESPSYTESVFINCPFDKEYEPLLHSILYTVFACGFIPRSALEVDDSSEIRLEKIARLIGLCKFGIHDISRTGLDAATGLPRFNMPFELGLFWGAKRYGQKPNTEKVALVFEKQKYSHQKFLSDLNGVDIKAHDNNPEACAKAVRNWLFTNSGRKTIPSPTVLVKGLHGFLREKLPALLQENHLQAHELTFNDYCFQIATALEASRQSKEKK